MLGRNIFLGLSSVFLIAAIPMAVYLVSQQQVLRSKAYSPQMEPKFTISGESVINGHASDPNVTLTIIFPTTTLQPDEFRVSNTIPGLEQANVVPYTGSNQTLPWTLDSSSPTPTVYLQLRINNQWQTPLFTSIPLIQAKK